MRPSTRTVLALAAALITAGCSRSEDPATELSRLERALQNGIAAPAATPAAEEETGRNLEPSSAADPDAHEFVQRALDALHTNQPADAIMLLQTAQQSTSLNADQQMAVQRTIRAVTADLVKRAERGDPRADAELKRIERFLSTR